MKKQDFTNIGSPVKEFINSFFGELKEGLDKQNLSMCSKEEAHSVMDLNAIATGDTKKGGGVKIWNALSGEASKNNSETNAQRITVYVKKKSQVDEEKEKAEIEIEKKRQQYAHRIALKGTD